MRFRKKPVEIEAVQWDGQGIASGAAPEWFRRAMWLPKGTAGGISRQAAELVISTLEGEMRALPGDWIIRGVAGEVYPCKPKIFAATYEAVE